MNDNDVYAEEFEDQYGGKAMSSEKNVMKQMSISDDAQHHDDEQLQKSLDDEYLDEFDEERTLRKLSSSGGVGCMKKQESIMEDDPELKHLEEQQNLKNQQLQQQQMHHHDELQELQMEAAEMKAKKSVTISEDEPMIHEKPREKRTARQRWHWAYNRIVHQQQVSWFF
jgi:hypothetical protein